MDFYKNQTNLYPLGKDKDILVKTFSENEDIIGLLLPNYNESTDDLDMLLKEHIYKTIEIDNTQCEAKTYICIETYVPQVDSDSIKEIGIIINVFCHESLLDLSGTEIVKYVNKGYFGSRIDMLIDCVDRSINGKRGIGIGKLRLRPRNPIEIYKPTNSYHGKSMVYIVSDFNDIG